MPTHAAPTHSGFDWSDFVDAQVAERGSLAAAALFLAERRGFEEDVESVERGLRRLRKRGTADGGVWGGRALRVFGLPTAVSDRVRWMGHYHTRFSDLPVSLCEELLLPWDRPPISESPARIWVLLGRASVALRRRDDPTPFLDQATLLEARTEPAARAELALVRAFTWTRADPAAADAAIDQAAGLLERAPEPDRACLFARWIDHRAYRLNKSRGATPDHAGAADLYREIPEDGPLFARCRRENGLGWSLLKLGDQAAAEGHARAGVRAAGDSGSLRMRAMALNLLAAVLDEARAGSGAEVRARAQGIARRLEDEALAVRFGRAR